MEVLLDTSVDLLTVYGFRIVAAAVIFVAGRWLIRLLAHGLERGMTRAAMDETLVKFTGNIAYAALFAFVVIAALAALGIQTTSFIAVLGAAGLAIGLALQGSLSNFAAGVMLVVFKPFKVGDYIEAGGAAGTVEEIMIFSTKMRTGNNVQVFVPNGVIFAGNIVNYSAKETRRIDLVFGCGYDDDIRRVRTVLEEIVAGDERILSDPAPTIAVAELAESSVNFVVRPWVKAADYWNVNFDLHEQVKRRFDEEEISIPYPQREVHLREPRAA